MYHRSLLFNEDRILNELEGGRVLRISVSFTLVSFISFIFVIACQGFLAISIFSLTYMDIPFYSFTPSLINYISNPTNY
jgi:hypothetical protein